LLPLIKRAAESADRRAALESVLAYIANRPLRTWTDADAERFEAQARYLGEVWREESGQATAFLQPEIQQRAQRLAEQLENTLRSSGESLETLEAALRLALERIKTAKTPP
jgi:methylphosphotriester-DNA--protein-cysteine methyltransferase